MAVNILTALSIFILFWAVNAESYPSLLTTKNSLRVSFMEDVLKARMYTSLANEVIFTPQFPDTVEVLKETFRKNDYILEVDYNLYGRSISIISIKTIRGQYYIKFEGNYVCKLKLGKAALRTLDDDNIFVNWSIQDSLEIDAVNGYLRIGRKSILTNPIYRKYRVVSHLNGKLYFIGYDGYNNDTNTFFATDLSNVHNDEAHNSIIHGETVNLNFEPHFIGLDQLNGNIFISSKYEVFILEKLHYYKDFNGLEKHYFQNPINRPLEKSFIPETTDSFSNYDSYEVDEEDEEDEEK